MAIRATCPQCKKVFSAQDEYLGKKVKCPGCSSKVEVLSPEDMKQRDLQSKEQDRWQSEQEKRIALIESRDRTQPGIRSYSQEFGTGLDRVRNFNPGAVSRFRKLRALSGFLLLTAYLLSLLLLTGAGFTIYWYSVGVISEVSTLILTLIGFCFVFVATFGFFKFIGELSWLLADLGDHQFDNRNISLDLREDLDRFLMRNAQQNQRRDRAV